VKIRNINLGLLCFLIVVYVDTGLNIGAAFGKDQRSVTIVIQNRSESDLSPSIRLDSGQSLSFTNESSNTFKANYVIDSDRWFNIVNISLLWKSAYLRSDHMKSDLEQHFSLRLRRTFPDTIVIPVFFSNDRTMKEIARLEELTGDDQQYEAFFRLWQIAQFYRETFTKKHEMTRAAAAEFFKAAEKLARRSKHFLIMNEEATRFAIEAFETERTWAVKADTAGGLYWEDLSIAGDFAKKGNCEMAMQIVEELLTLKSAEPNRFNLAFPNQPTAFEDQSKFVNQKCPQSAPETISPAEVGVVSIQIPANSSDGPSWPLNDRRWKVDFPIESGEAVGIGHIIDEGDVGPQTLFSMHDHHYAAPQIPDPTRAVVTYTFSNPVEVSDVKLIQHTNGVTQIEGFIGDSSDELRPMGISWTTIGDLNGKSIFNERQTDIFKFLQPGKGRVFRFVIRKTSLSDGYAFYRAYPRNSRHQAYLALTGH
jgi:hypothetical protein